LLLGAWGPRGHTRVAAAARARGLELTEDGPLTLAAPAGSMINAQAGGHRVWIVGRIDTDGLPVELRSAGADAALIVAGALERLGATAQACLHGAYLIVVHDFSRRTAWVSHDHLGARTLAFAQHGAEALFAEHQVDLLSMLPATPAPDRLALVQWIDRGTLPGNRSLYSSVQRLPAGHRLEFSESGSELRCFWRPAYGEPCRVSADESALALRSGAFAAVRRAAAGLHRPAVKLSGGLDSACIAAGLAANAEDRRLLALAGVFPGYPEADETGLIEQTARTAGIELVCVRYEDAPVFAPVHDYIRRWAFPPWSPNTAIWRPLMAVARSQGVDGLLDGEGGDELFGLARYLIADRLRGGRLRSAWRLAGMLPGLGGAPPVGLRLRILRAYGVGGTLPEGVQRLRRRLLSPREGISSLVYDTDVPGLRHQDEEWSWKTGDGPIWWTAAVDERVNGAHRLDASGELLRASVDAGIDQRHPFLHDAALVEAVLAIPPEQQFDAVRDRPLLRDGLAGLIPPAVVRRFDKSYFNELTSRALAGAEGSLLLAQVSAADAPIRAYVRADPLDGLAAIATERGGARHRLAARLFRIASVDCWLRQLADPRQVEMPAASRG
jgi:asparagine synthetase B (glutamine-hydrolysing)